ncbi:MAG TPA: FHA domain-containing protein [Thermomicrobiales bacterium]|nr:FHA domain-containing protein [Thermomicrobiales bacterium]
MVKSPHDEDDNATSTERFDAVARDQKSPRARRRSGVSSEPLAPVPEQDAPAEQGGVAYATLGMLDGAIVARLQCHENLGRVVLGRGSLSEVRLHDPFVHRVHAELHWDPASRAHVITHGGGANGTFVNLQRIDQPARLTDGARIRVGKTELVYRRFWYPGA